MLYSVTVSKNPRYAASVDWYVGKERKRKFFKSLKKAESWAEARNLELRNSGVNALAVPEWLRVDAVAAHKLLEPFGKSLVEAAKFAADRWKEDSRSLPLGLAKARFFEVKKKKSDRYKADLERFLALFVERFGSETKCSQVTQREAAEWLETLGSAHTHDYARRLVSSFFGVAVSKGWCTTNPVEKIAPVDDPEDVPVGVLTPAQASKLLECAAPEIKGVVAVGLFCGLRRTELMRVRAEDIRSASGVVMARVSKKRGVARRFIRIRPCLAEWVKAHPIQPFTEHTFRAHFETAREDAKIDPWPHNAMRHSFCSYALEHEKNLNELVLEMGHTNPHTFFEHYRELVTPEDAAAFWEIKPK